MAKPSRIERLLDDEDLAVAYPPTGSRLAGEWRLRSAAELTVLRSRLTDALAREQAESAGSLLSSPDKVVLIASELATNALEHGLPPTTVRLARAKDHVLLEVTDQDLTSKPVFSESRIPGGGGFGLHLARQLCLAVGWYRDGGVKTVWAALST